jgi:hypothetical protein
LNIQDDSSSDEDTGEKTLTVEERKAQAAKEREEKQRKYEERRQELFGSAGTVNSATSVHTNSGLNTSNENSGSNTPTPTPPGSRSATPNRSRGRGGKRGGSAGLAKDVQQKREKDLFDPSYSAKPDSVYLQRREKGLPDGKEGEVQPIRSPRGPDGSGRGGFGFAPRGGKAATAAPTLPTT